MITRSGSNQFHGSAYDFLRNNDLDSADYFENQNPAPLNKLPHLERNVFGGTVGGPVVIPHVYNGRNRTFFFFDYEGTRRVRWPRVRRRAQRGGEDGRFR